MTREIGICAAQPLPRANNLVLRGGADRLKHCDGTKRLAQAPGAHRCELLFLEASNWPSSNGEQHTTGIQGGLKNLIELESGRQDMASPSFLSVQCEAIKTLRIVA